MKKYLLLAVLVIGFVSCKKQPGTDVDNPFIDPVGSCDGYNNGNGRCMPTPVVSLQVSVICQKVNTCLDAATDGSQDGCNVLLLNQNGLGTYINTTAKNYRELDSLYNTKKLLTNSVKWNSCLHAINDLDCQSSTFTNSYNVNEPLNFSNIHKILQSSASCLEVYSMKPATSGTLTVQE